MSTYMGAHYTGRRPLGNSSVREEVYVVTRSFLLPAHIGDYQITVYK